MLAALAAVVAFGCETYCLGDVERNGVCITDPPARDGGARDAGGGG